jgi:hypothetical protein
MSVTNVCAYLRVRALYLGKELSIGVDFYRQQGSSTPNNFNAGQTPYRLALLALAISPCHLLWMGLGTLNIFSKSTPLELSISVPITADIS